MKVTLSQATTLVQTCGHTNTFLFRGQPGIGKSSILHTLTRAMPDYHPCYIDTVQCDLGDISMPVVDRDEMVTHYAPNARFGVAKSQTRPILLMLDELTKASRPVLNMLLPVILERRLGDHPLPTGSIVFATGNLDTDGVGDNLPSHAYNRMTVVPIANPTAEEWIQWATHTSSTSSIAPEVLAFAQQYPNVFECYVDDPTSTNPYIFNPLRHQTRAFCSPRSLAHASHIVSHRHTLGEATLPALIGTVGESAARDMDALLRLSDKLPSVQEITAAPTTARLPTDAAAYFILAFALATASDKTTLPAIMTYLNRWEAFEAQALYITTVAGNREKAPMACANAAFRQRAMDFGRYF